jgi:hypothetical protein
LKSRTHRIEKPRRRVPFSAHGENFVREEKR